MMNNIAIAACLFLQAEDLSQKTLDYQATVIQELQEKHDALKEILVTTNELKYNHNNELIIHYVAKGKGLRITWRQAMWADRKALLVDIKDITDAASWIDYPLYFFQIKKIFDAGFSDTTWPDILLNFDSLPYECKSFKNHPCTIASAMKPVSGFVYFARTKSGIVKIGYSKNVQSRLRQLQTSCPAKIELLCVIRASRKVEKMLHEELSSHRIHGEWFRESEPVIRIALSLTNSFLGASYGQARCEVVKKRPTRCGLRPNQQEVRNGDSLQTL